MAKEINCLCCYDIINDENVVKYMIFDDDKWQNYDYCLSCVKYLLEHKWYDYIKGIKYPDCEKNFKYLLECGLPKYLTVDTKYHSIVIKKLYYENSEKTSNLITSLSIIEFENLKKDIFEFYTNFSGITDYLFNIKILLQKYNL